MPTLRSLVRLSFISFLGLTSLLILILISSSPIQERLVIHDQIHSLPREFMINGNADPNHILTLTIELVSNNMTGLEQELYAVSDPKSPRYGQHLNKTQVDLFVRPSDDASTMLDQWLANQDIAPSSKSSAGHLVKIEVSVSKANKMFNTTFQSMAHIPSNRSVVRATTYSLPARLANHTQGIYPITNLPQPLISPLVRTQTATSNTTFRRGVDSGCENVVSPGCLQDLYNIPGDTTQGATGGGVGVLAFAGSDVKGKDIAKYLRENRPDVVLSGVQLDVVSVLGGDVSQEEFTTPRGTIDTEMMLGISPHTSITIYPNQGDGELTDMLDTLNFLLDQDELPSVLELNYFLFESAEDSDAKVEKAVCNAMMKLGTRGVSILATAGDPGVSCFASTGGPTFPGGCPFVTSVGSTTFSSGAEIASSQSPGGFSNVFPRPLYQSETVNDYLKQIGSLNSGMFNSSGRAFPDIAVITGNVPLILDGEEVDMQTTLSDTPIVAAIIADLNAQRQNQGKSPLGFLNPLLYSNPQAFKDITQGNNSGCEVITTFPAVQGWDVLTGLGSPNYTALLQII